MQRGMLLVILIAFVAIGSVIFFGTVGVTALQQRVGDLRPALLPAGPALPQVAGQEVSGPQADGRLKVPQGYQVTLFSTQTPGARDLQFSPDGTLLVSLRNQGRVIALPDVDQDGQADRVVEVISGLRNPHGLAFYDGKLFVAEERQVSRYLWDEETLTAQLDKKLFDSPNGVTLPGGGGGHQTRSIVFDKNGNLYLSVGSTCNVCIQSNPWHAAVVVTDQDGNSPRVFSKGLRNAVFLTMHPETDKVWVTEMGRDLLGDNLPADEINILQENGDFGWPYCYGKKVYDRNFGQQDPGYCQSTISPVFELQAHSAPLGLEFIQSEQFPAEWNGDLLVAFHGSWNRSVPTGYKVVHLNVEGDTVTEQSDFMTGFLQGGQSIGRPVDVTFDAQGRLYVSDDKAGSVYLISRTSP